MATSSEISTNILDKLNSLISSTTDPDALGALINQYEQTIDLIREGYQFSEVDLLNLPASLRSEVITTFEQDRATFSSLVNAEIQKLLPFNIKYEDGLRKTNNDLISFRSGCYIFPSHNISGFIQFATFDVSYYNSGSFSFDFRSLAISSGSGVPYNMRGLVNIKKYEGTLKIFSDIYKPYVSHRLYYLYDNVLNVVLIYFSIPSWETLSVELSYPFNGLPFVVDGVFVESLPSGSIEL